MTSIPAPNYTQVPNIILDSMMMDMGEAEFKIVMAIVRNTFGWHKKRKRMSLTYIMKATGMSKQGVLNGIEQAIERGIVSRRKDGQSYQYEIVISESNKSSVESLVAKESEDKLVNEVDQLENTASQRSRPVSGVQLVNEVDPKKERKENNNNILKKDETLQAKKEPVVVDGFKSTKPPAKEERIGKSKEAEKASTPANGKANGKSNGAGLIPPEIVNAMSEIGIDSTSHYLCWNGLSQNKTIEKSKNLISFYGEQHTYSQGVEQNPIGIGYVVTKLRDNVTPNKFDIARFKELKSKFNSKPKEGEVWD